MAVYVDSLMNWGWKYGRSCHMIADSIEELKDFAVLIGMRLEWFQDKRVPHFDLTERRRKNAVKLGAIELGRKDYVAKLVELGYAKNYAKNK